MTLFSDLPADVLALVLQDFESIIIWKTGDKRLMSKLANGGVNSVVLKDTRFGSNSIFPMCLASFSALRELTILTDSNYLKSIYPLSSCLRSLPKSLKKLRLSCFNSTAAFNAATSADDLSPSSSHRNESIVPDDPICIPKNVFPRLETLILDRGHQQLTDSDLKRLPPTLTHLEFPYSVLLSSSSMEYLPQNLTRLALRHLFFEREITVALASMLPRTLLELHVLPDLSISNDAIDALPKSLTMLGRKDDLEWTSELASIWPPLVKSLHIEVFPNHQFGANFTLPNYLTTLKIGGRNDEEFLKLSTPLLESLPKTIVELSLYPSEIDWTDFKDGILPPGLKKLTIPSSAQFTRETAQCLPRTLTSFSTRVNPTLWSPLTEENEDLNFIDFSAFTGLPTTLTALYCNFLRVEPEKGEFSLLKGLPESLQWLTLESPMEPRNVSFLPLNITNLSITCDRVLPEAEAAQLPRNLKSLTLSAPVHAGAISALPNSLTSLIVQEILPDGADEKTSKIVRLQQRTIGDFPAHSDFSESDEEWDHLSDEYEYEYRPIYSAFGNDDEGYYANEPTEMSRKKRILRKVHVRSWPASLETLHIQSLFNYAEDLFKCLPPTLTDFSSLMAPMEALFSLPPKLRRLAVGIHHGALTGDHLAALPRTLEEFDTRPPEFDLPKDVSDILPPHIDPRVSWLVDFTATRMQQIQELEDSFQ